MTSNGFSSGDYDLTPSSMKYKTLDEDVAPTNTERPQTEMKRPQQKCGGTPCTLKEWLFIGLVFVLIVLVLAFGIASSQNMQQTTSTGGSSSQTGGMSENYPKSCADALKQGITSSGIVTIQPDKTMKPFQVYCEMTAAGGGWTMISSIHEDDITHRCGSGDMWSSSSRSSSNVPCVYCHYYYGSQRTDPVNSGSYSSEGFQHWKNLVTFGEPSAATSADYKSKAYYSVPGSNMMIWHVPNDAMLSTIGDSAFFKYYTDSNFLAKYGSTLQSLYSNYAPLKRLLPNGIQGQFLPCFETNWAFYNRSSTSRPRPSRPRPPIRRPGPTGNPFTTSSEPNLQPPTEEGFFINVNGGEFVKIEGGKYVNVSSQINVSVSDSESRTILAWVGNEDKSIKSILFKTTRTSASTSRSKYPYYFSNSDFSMQYQYTCTTNCSLVFVVGSSKLWDTRTPLNRFNNTQPFVSYLNLTSEMQRFMVGYTEFPKSSSGNPTSSTLRSMLAKLVGCFGNYQTHDLSKFPSISSPAKFIKGEMSDSIRNVTPGFIELRKYDSLGYPFALCPGIKVKDGSDPSMHCVGGVQTHYSLRNRCGDFAAWDQLIEHNKKRTPSGATDITSTLLLFVR